MRLIAVGQCNAGRTWRSVASSKAVTGIILLHWRASHCTSRSNRSDNAVMSPLLIQNTSTKCYDGLCTPTAEQHSTARGRRMRAADHKEAECGARIGRGRRRSGLSSKGLL